MSRTIDERTRDAESWGSIAARLDQITVAALVATLGTWTYDYFSSENLIVLDLGALVVTLGLAAGMLFSYRKSTYVAH